jgi:hypothetical protein
MRLPAAVRHTRLHPGRDRLPLVQRRGRPRPSALARVRGFARENADFEILSLLAGLEHARTIRLAE